MSTYGIVLDDKAFIPDCLKFPEQYTPDIPWFIPLSPIEDESTVKLGAVKLTAKLPAIARETRKLPVVSEVQE